MKKLNLRTPKPYDYSSVSGTENCRSVFYCVAEGPTEESYFMGIKNNRVELGIKGDVQIEIVEKEEGYETYSHPKQLVTACLYYLGRIDKEGNEIPKENWELNCKWNYRPEADIVCCHF